MINRLSKKPKKKASKKKSVKKISKRKFKNPDRDEGYSSKESAELKSLISSQLNEWRKQNSGENYEPSTLDLLEKWKKEVGEDWDPDDFYMLMETSAYYTNKLLELMQKFADNKPIKIEKYEIHFD